MWIRLWETQTAAFMFQTIQSSTTAQQASSQTMTSLKGSSPGTQIRVMGLNYSVAAVVGVSGQVQGSTEVIATLKLEQKGSVTQYMRVGKTSVGKGKQNKLEGSPVGGIGIQGHIDSPVGPVACSALGQPWNSRPSNLVYGAGCLIRK
ncbi:hypothetical protein LINPERHAP1_LOCUS35606 [Linum perenne]